MGRPTYLAPEEKSYILAAAKMDAGYSIPNGIITMAERVKHLRDTVMSINSNINHRSIMKYSELIVAHTNKK